MHRVQQEIWLALDSRAPGGIESHVRQLAEGLKRRGQLVRVVFLRDYGEHPLHDVLRAADIPSLVLDGRIGSLWRHLRRARPALLHTHGYKAGILGRVAARLNRIPVISTFHAGERPSGRLALYDCLDRHTARLAQQRFAVSPAIMQRLPVTAELTDNFVDDAGLAISHGRQIAFVGRLSEEKGPDRFLRLASEFPQQQFHLYGDGPQMAALRQTAPKNLQFHGQQDDMTPLWQNIGLLVMPSRHEGLPMAALEAMARGIPVLASNVGALDQLVEDGTNGWLVENGDQEALAERLGHWLAMDTEQIQTMQQASQRQITRRYSADIAIPRLIAVYERLVSTSNLGRVRCA